MTLQTLSGTVMYFIYSLVSTMDLVDLATWLRLVYIALHVQPEQVRKNKNDEIKFFFTHLFFKNKENTNKVFSLIFHENVSIDNAINIFYESTAVAIPLLFFHESTIYRSSDFVIIIFHEFITKVLVSLFFYIKNLQKQ